MHYFEYPSVDTTLYQASQSLNTGLDAVLEVRKDVSPTGDTVNYQITNTHLCSHHFYTSN